MAKRDYYEVLGVDRNADERGDQEGLPQAGPEASSRPQSQRQIGRGEIQGTGRGLRSPERSPIPRRLRPIRPCRLRVPRPRSPAPAAFTIPAKFSARFSAAGSIFDDLFGTGGSAIAGGGQRGDDLRYDMEITFLEARPGLREGNHASTSWARASRAAGAGRKKGPRPRPAPPAAGAARCVSSRGIFSIAQTCPHCGGRGRIMDKPCRPCGGERPPRTVGQDQDPNSAGGGQRGRACVPPATARRECAAGAPGDLYVVLHVQPHEIFQRDGDDLLCEVPISFAQAALGAEIEVPTLGAPVQVKMPPGTQNGRGVPAERARA